jgi:hypothetical protein
MQYLLVSEIYRHIPTNSLASACKQFYHHLDKFLTSVTRDMKWTFDKVDTLRLETLASRPGALTKVFTPQSASERTSSKLQERYDKAVKDFIEKLDFTLMQNELELESALTAYVKALADYFFDTYKIIRSKRF